MPNPLTDAQFMSTQPEQQLGLFDEPITAVLAWPEMPCMFGNMNDPTTRHHCAACTEYCAELGRQFDADVVDGKYNQRGYTLNEWTRAKKDPALWKDAMPISLHA